MVRKERVVESGRTDVDVSIGEVIGAVALHPPFHPLAREDYLAVSGHPHAVATLSTADLRAVRRRRGREVTQEPS
jgi:hypothetical protein